MTYTGSNSVSFAQIVPHGTVMVNDGVGSDSNTLQSYAQVVTADNSGEIHVTISQRSGSDGIALNALAIQQFGPPLPSLGVSIDVASMSENGGSATGTVTRPGDTSAALVVNLSSDDTTEATTPVSVEIPAGSASATFPITAVDDALIDGTQTTGITVTAAGFLDSTAFIDVTDDDVPFTGPLVGVDFDFTGTSSPVNWTALGGTATPVTQPNLLAEDGTISPFDLTVISSVGTVSSTSAAVNSSTVPIHTQPLNNLDGQIYTFGNAVEFVWSDLTPGNDYEVYVFGLEGFLQPINQAVLITGAGVPTSFSQFFGLNTLVVNDQVGSSSRNLSEYASIIEAS